MSNSTLNTITGTISAPSSVEDEDTYVFFLEENQEVFFSVLQSPQDLSTKYFLLRPDGSTITQPTLSAGESDTFTFFSSVAGEYSVRIFT